MGQSDAGRNRPDADRRPQLERHFPRRRAIVPGVLLGLVVGGSGMAAASIRQVDPVPAAPLRAQTVVEPQPAPAPTKAPPPKVNAPVVWSAATFHVHVVTTSDWAAVQLKGGPLTGRRTTGVDGTRIGNLGDGWSLNGPGSFDVDVVMAVTDADVAVHVAKGYAGVVSVEVTRAAGPLLTVVNERHDTGRSSSANRVSSTLRRSVLESTIVRDLRHGDSRRLALAFAYPWFATYDDDDLAERPTDPRSWSSAAGVLAMTRQARAAGIDGFVLSYNGSRRDSDSLDLSLKAAAQTGGVVAPYLETEEAVKQAGLLGSPTGIVKQWLHQALDRSKHPAFLSSNGKPVVFVYSMNKLSLDEWASVERDLARDGHPVTLIGDTGAGNYTQVSGGYHHYGVVEDKRALSSRSQYAAALLRGQSVVDAGVTPLLSVATVSPGYDDTALRGRQNPKVHRAGGARYTDTWDAAISGDPDWVVVTSWNEWYEGTEIEPGTLNGGMALKQTKEQIAAWKAR